MMSGSKETLPLRTLRVLEKTDKTSVLASRERHERKRDVQRENAHFDGFSFSPFTVLDLIIWVQLVNNSRIRNNSIDFYPIDSHLTIICFFFWKKINNQNITLQICSPSITKFLITLDKIRYHRPRISSFTQTEID